MRAVGIVCFVLGLIYFLWIIARLYLALLAVVDKQLSPIVALKHSFRITEGNVWKIIGVWIIHLLIVLGCAITLGIGLIWGVPWMLIIIGEVYRRLSMRQDVSVLA